MDFSGSGLVIDDNSSANGTVPGLYWPCRSSPISDNSTSSFVWHTPPQLQGARPYVATVEAVFFIIGFLWNSFVLISYCLRPRLLKEPANIYLFNLALIDILLTIFITLTSVISVATGEFIFGASDFTRCHYCEFLGVVLHTFISLSLHTITALSIDRFVLLSYPMKYKSLFDWKKALVVQLTLWVISFGISIPPVLGFGEYEYSVFLASCNARWTGKGNRGIDNIYYVAFFGVEALIPILILMFTNVWVVKIVKKFLRKRITRQRTYREDNSSSKLKEEKKYQQQQNQLVKVFGALFIAHIICWTPVLTVLFVALGIGAHRIPAEVFIVAWLTYLSIPVIHPILESFFIKDLRSTLHKTKKTVGSSLNRARGSFHSQVSTTSLLRTFSRSSRLSLSNDLPKPPMRKTASGTLSNAAILEANNVKNKDLKRGQGERKLQHNKVSFNLNSSAARPRIPSLSEVSSDDVFSPLPDSSPTMIADLSGGLHSIAEH